MISEVQKWPSRPTLEDLKECLDYCSTSWVGLYCRLGGAHLLLEVTSLLPTTLPPQQQLDMLHRANCR